MDHDILQSTLDDVSHLLIPSSQMTLEAELAVGGYGQVFLGVLGSPDSQIKVAVKQLRITQTIQVRRHVAIRLARELKVWAKAKHTNILELVGFYLSDDHLCAQFVSAYMANGNVKEYINRLRPNLATRLRFVQGITSGMSYLHNCNPAICHGDLKPTNVLVNESLDAVLCDFGLAKFILESGVSTGLTTSNSVKGSTRYMAPELLLEGETNQALKSDVWAWACTTFEVLTDCGPFPNAKRDPAVIMSLVLGQPPGSVELLDRLVSENHIIHRLTLDSLKSIIPRCWIMDSTQRPSSSEILDCFISSGGNTVFWTSANPLQSNLYSNLGTLYRFDTVNNGGRTITTLYRSMKQGNEDRIAKLEWGTNYSLGRATIGRKMLSMGDLVLPAGAPYWRSYASPDGHLYTWRPDIDISSEDFVLEDYLGNIIARFRSVPGRKYNVGEVHGELFLADRRMVLYPPLMDMVCLTAMLNRILNDREQ